MLATTISGTRQVQTAAVVVVVVVVARDLGAWCLARSRSHGPLFKALGRTINRAASHTPEHASGAMHGDVSASATVVAT